MWIVERDGKYRYMERYTCPRTGKYKYVSITLNSNSSQAHKKAQIALQERIEERIGINPSKSTLGRVIDEFYAFKATYTKEITVQKGRSALLNFLKDKIPLETLISKVTARDVQEAISERIQRGLYGSTKKGYGELRQVLKYAYKMDILDNISFLDKITMPKRPMSKDLNATLKQRFLDAKELGEVLSMVSEMHPALGLVFEFQSLTGLRFGEMMALRIQDYDKKKHVIDVNATLRFTGSAKSEHARTPPKNVHSYRLVSLSDRAVQIIEQFILVSNARRMFKPGTYKTDYIFTTEGGLPFNIQYANTVLRKIPYHKKLSTHIFRHTHISMLASANVPLKAIMDRVGHNEPKTTMAVYTHVTDAMRDSVSNALNALEKIIAEV